MTTIVPGPIAESDEESHGVISFEVLGPVRAVARGQEIDLGSPQQRAVLAVLLLADGLPVAVDEVVARVWGEEAPRSARGILRTYVYRLRRALATVCPSGEFIEFVAGSYRVRSGSYELDADGFTRLLREAERLERTDPRSARDCLRAALALWKGAALQGLDGDWFTAQAHWLESRRVDALIALFPLELSEGEPGDLLNHVAELWRRQPTQEKLAELYMTGLWFKDQRSEALGVYEGLRRALRDELGIDPSPALQSLHVRILRAEPTPAGAAAHAALPTPGDRGPVPAVAPAAPAPADLASLVQAPAALYSDAAPFVGRSTELEAMIEALTADTPRSIGIAGLGGMGKSRLAIRVSHAVRSHFPDGQVSVRVGDQPASAVVLKLLGSLGFTAAQLPETTALQVGVWRTLTAERRMLVVLDDVRANDDLRMLLPSGPQSAVIVTSERRIPRLPWISWTRLGPLSTAESVELMGELAGAGRVGAEPETSARVAEECSNIPLAVEVAAARLNDRPNWSIARIEQELLADLASPVVMQADCAIVDAPLARAVSFLGGPALAACHRLALEAPDRFDPAWAACALGTDERTATALLEELVDANLLLSLGDRCYAHLGLVRAYLHRQASMHLVRA
ncbi:AfsR/SARP family transcriptional regulator [Herbiconiux solani]|uniref:AfsR/SARP family transcriptional regulator n=1 Tax=Herbiconiux solani TaxID=661329 RepID=UPI000825880B|nr:BTAD domain-containing putative transcriptional regulator [Herbiconiux solani]